MLFYVFAQLLFSSLDPCVICIGLLLCSTTELLLCNYTALGVAFFAAYQIGEFKSLNEITRKWKKDAMFKPKISKKLRVNLLKGWQQAIRKTLA